MQAFLTMLGDDSGQGLVEYALIAALIAVVAMGALNVLGHKASNSLCNAAGFLS